MSYIPNKSDLQYKGEYDASANSPSLSDSNGETGDLYRVTISGVTDFGSGPIELKENDYILFNTNGQWEKFISQNIVKGGKKPIIQLTSTDNDTNINNDTITVISWDNTLIKDNGYVHNTNSNTGQVTINESGRYLVYVSLAYDVNNYRINPRIRFRLNGYILEGEGLTGYVRDASGHNEGSNNLSRIIDVNAGDTLEVITDRIANDGTVTLRPNESIFFIQKFQSVVYQTQQIDADTLGGLESTEFAKNGENLFLNSRKVTSDYSITNNDYGIYADASNGPITITVPDAELFNGYIFSITKTDNSTNQVSIETINNNFAITLKSQFHSITIQSNGNNYFVMSEFDSPFKSLFFRFPPGSILGQEVEITSAEQGNYNLVIASSNIESYIIEVNGDAVGTPFTLSVGDNVTVGVSKNEFSNDETIELISESN
jgi:hypothetical protein